MAASHKKNMSLRSRFQTKINLNISSQIHSKNTMMAESLFRVFDEDKSGTLSFEEYFQASQVGHGRQY